MKQIEVNEKADNAALELARMILHKAEAFERKPEDIPLDENNMIKYSEDLGFDEAGVCCLMYWNQTELLTRVNFKGENLIVRVVALSPFWDAEGNPRVPVIPAIPTVLMVGLPRDDHEIEIYDMDFPVGVEYLRQLEECMSIVKEYMWRNNIEPVISEDQESCYQSRTAKNAEWSDITLAFAVDVNSPGELETKAAAGDKFLSFEIPDGDETITETSYVKGLVSEVVSAIVCHPSYPDLCRQGIKLNIAGNRLSVLARHGISQDGIDNLLLSVMKGLLESSIPIAEVRSGGQSGVDEAGIHAAQDCSLPCSILCPKGFRFSTAEGEELSGAERFMARFKYKGDPVCNTIGQEIRKIQDDSCQESPIPTSFKTIDRVLGGIRPSQLVILASRSGVGKSSFAMTMARNIAVERDIPTAYFTMQLSSEIFTKRLLRQEASIALHHASGVEQCNGEEMGRVTEALSRSPLYVDDTRFLSIDEFLIKAEKLVRENGVRVMIIDFIYLMLMQKNKWGRRRRGTDEDFRQAIRTLKHAASELRVAIMVLVNMPQSISPGQSPVPTLNNLYEQGLDYDVLKENVDMVWMLYRPGMYGLTNDNSKAELIVAHNAHGDRDLVIDLKFETDYARFTDSPDEM